MTALFNLLYRFAGIWFILWTLTIFLLCAIPGEYIPSNNWLDLLSVDKLVHASIFFTLCMLGMLSIHHYQWSTKWVMPLVGMAILYGAGLEYMQGHYFRHRSEDWHDIIANSTGCLLAYFFRNRFLNWIIAHTSA
jgi:TRAP-type uncharacterized transport system fused permease subunit